MPFTTYAMDNVTRTQEVCWYIRGQLPTYQFPYIGKACRAQIGDRIIIAEGCTLRASKQKVAGIIFDMIKEKINAGKNAENIRKELGICEKTGYTSTHELGMLYEDRAMEIVDNIEIETQYSGLATVARIKCMKQGVQYQGMGYAENKHEAKLAAAKALYEQL